jgi:hypothetical protein
MMHGREPPRIHLRPFKRAGYLKAVWPEVVGSCFVLLSGTPGFVWGSGRRDVFTVVLGQVLFYVTQ